MYLKQKNIMQHANKKSPTEDPSSSVEAASITLLIIMPLWSKKYNKMSKESNLLKLVAEVGSKVAAAKSKISASEAENDKWQATLLEAQKSLSERKLYLLKLRVRLSSEKEQLAEKEETFNSCLTEIQSSLSELTDTQSQLAQARLALSSLHQRHQRLQHQREQHVTRAQLATGGTESASQLMMQQRHLDNIRQQRSKLDAKLRQGAAVRGVQQEAAAAAKRRDTLQQKLQERRAAEEADAAAAHRLEGLVKQKREELSAEQRQLSAQLTVSRDQQRMENERLRALELRSAELQAQLDSADAGQC